MKFFLLLTLFIPICSFSQNLIPNGSFELQIKPIKSKFAGNLEKAMPWFPAGKGSPDLIRQGENMFGKQKAAHGESYAGFIAYDADNKDFREYLEVKLISDLIEGKEYCLRFNVAPAKQSYAFTDELGIVLSKDSLLSKTWNVMEEIPTWKTPKFAPISDTSSWKLFEYKFIAKGDERFLTIGNFRPDHATMFQLNLQTSYQKLAYLYIDDVYLGVCSPTVENAIPNSVVKKNSNGKVRIPNLLTPNGDGFNDVFIIDNLPNYSGLIITDKKGNVVYKSDNYKNDWEGLGVLSGNYNFELKLPDGNRIYGTVDLVRKK